jgi:hypothetical protein
VREQGTYRLVWTQGITRTRWVPLKLGPLVAATLLVALALTAFLTWWRTPFDHLEGSCKPSAFDVEGTVPLAYTIFAVALRLGVGTVLRRTVPAVDISAPRARHEIPTGPLCQEQNPGRTGTPRAGSVSW